MSEDMLKLAERIDAVGKLSLLPRIPVPCPGGYTYLESGDLKKAAAALRASQGKD